MAGNEITSLAIGSGNAAILLTGGKLAIGRHSIMMSAGAVSLKGQDGI